MGLMHLQVAEDPYWVDEAVPTGNNKDSSGAAVNPLLTTTTIAGTAHKGLPADTTSFVDTGVGVGTWTYRVEAFNDAGETWCEADPYQTVTITA